MWLKFRSRKHPELTRVFQVRMSDPGTAKTCKEKGVEIAMKQFMSRQKTIPPKRAPGHQCAHSSHFLLSLPSWHCRKVRTYLHGKQSGLSSSTQLHVQGDYPLIYIIILLVYQIMGFVMRFLHVRVHHYTWFLFSLPPSLSPLLTFMGTSLP